MAKRTTITPPASAEPDIANEGLLEVAEMLLGDFFFDPENELAYKRKLAEHRPAGTAGILLDEDTIELPDAHCIVRIEALRSLTHFRVRIDHPSFTATVEGTWSFENEELSRVRFTRTGDSALIAAVVEDIIEAVDGGGLDDEEISDFLNGVQNADDDEVPRIGDDPTEPPEASPLDRSRLKAIAKRVARHRATEIAVEDRTWLEQMPQMLPVVTESLIAAASAPKRDDALVHAYQSLLPTVLEFVRYRQDRGWNWADDMLDAFQQRLVAIGKADTMPREDWFMMCAALTEARVPIDDDAKTALADAGFRPDELDGPPEAMMRMVREFMDELARMVSSPFEVIDALKGSGAILPAMLRSFMATELALSPHQILRDAVPLLLLDNESSVRTAAAGALEQTAHPDTMSPDALRRAITIRNWIPASDRPPLDAAIRKARLAGVEIGVWPTPSRDLEIYATTLDGSGAQSILATSRVAKKGVFAGLLLRHGTGVVDGWADSDLARGKIGKLLREAQMAAPTARVDKGFVDTMVQHAIGASVEHNAVPPPSLLQIAEILGGAEWKDRLMDVKAEADQLFEALDPSDRTPAGIEAGFARGADWMGTDDVFGSWFEDGPQVHKTLAKLPRTDRNGMIALVMSDILPAKRAQWTERFLVLALWCQAAAEAKQRAKGRDVVLVAHALASDAPLGAIPIMGMIAANTVRATLLGGW
ncbi:MAG TPA: hypothetical protein VGM32_11580 [Rhodopila sp.]|jgi:hypothetical protein